MSTKYKFADQEQLHVFAGIVERAEDYLYSSARNYCEIPGLIDITLVGPMVY